MELVRGLFHLLFGREPDDDSYVQMLTSGSISPRQFVEWLVDSAEWSHAAPMTQFGPSLHYGRGVFIRSLRGLVASSISAERPVVIQTGLSY